LQHHSKMYIYITLPLCDLNKSPGVCDVGLNRWYESTQDVLSNHKWNNWVSTITSLRQDLLLRVHQPYLCLLYVWVQKQVTERSREITYGLDQIVVVKYLGKSSLSHPISLSKEDRRESERESLNLKGMDWSDWLKWRASKITSEKMEVLSLCRPLFTNSSRRGVFLFTSDSEMPSSLDRVSRLSSPFSWTTHNRVR